VTTPVGELGVEAEYSVSRWLALSVGAGLGLYGPQVAVMPRLRLGFGRGRSLTVGAGASFGRYGWFENWIPDTCKEQCAQKTGDVVWGNAEVGLELGDARLSLRFFLGYGVPLNPGALKCDPTIGQIAYSHCLIGHANDGLALPLPYAGAAVGFSFALGGG
jgi:hypothetical protein